MIWKWYLCIFLHVTFFDERNIYHELLEAPQAPDEERSLKDAIDLGLTAGGYIPGVLGGIIGGISSVTDIINQLTSEEEMTYRVIAGSFLHAAFNSIDSYRRNFALDILNWDGGDCNCPTKHGSCNCLTVQQNDALTGLQKKYTVYQSELELFKDNFRTTLENEKK